MWDRIILVTRPRLTKSGVLSPHWRRLDRANILRDSGIITAVKRRRNRSATKPHIYAREFPTVDRQILKFKPDNSDFWELSCRLNARLVLLTVDANG